jgi:hypothetical protein
MYGHTYSCCSCVECVLDELLDGRLEVDNHLAGRDPMDGRLVNLLDRVPRRVAHVALEDKSTGDSIGYRCEHGECFVIVVRGRRRITGELDAFGQTRQPHIERSAADTNTFSHRVPGTIVCDNDLGLQTRNTRMLVLTEDKQTAEAEPYIAGGGTTG